MPREGAIIFRDLVGKLDVLNIECEKCSRRGRYRLDQLFERYWIDAKLFDRTEEITARKLGDLCGARCPGLPKVVLTIIETHPYRSTEEAERSLDAIL
jgi:hypothetical protein